MPKSLLTSPPAFDYPPHQQWKILKIFICQDLVLLSCFLCSALVIGYAIHNILLCLFIASSLFFSLQLYYLYLLNRWMMKGCPEQVPYLLGVWRILLNNIIILQNQERQLHQEMHQLIEKAQYSLKNLAEGIVILNHKHQIEWGNLQAIELLNIRMEHYGLKIEDILTDDDLIEYLKNPDFFLNGITILSPEYQNRYIQIKLTEFGEYYRLLIAYDVTRIHNLEQVRKNFVDNVSHELRTPLTVLSGYLEIIQEQEILSQGLDNALHQMQLQTKRMTALVNDLLLLSNLENQQNSQYHQIINMAELLNHLLDDAQVYNFDYGHALNLEVDSHYDLIGVESAINSAFINLITNAIKYTPVGGTIRIGWHDHDEGAYFSVQDTGIGISAEHLPRLTERFYRVDTARSRATGGTGLGLAIVKHALLQHHARLEIQSKEGEGSIFKVIFPKKVLSAHQNAYVQWVDNE